MGTVAQRWTRRLRNTGETLVFRTIQWTSVQLGRFIRQSMWLFLYGAEVSSIVRAELRASGKADLRRD